jgi:ABC-type methionine transport system permease subunit
LKGGACSGLAACEYANANADANNVQRSLPSVVLLVSLFASMVDLIPIRIGTGCVVPLSVLHALH